MAAPAQVSGITPAASGVCAGIRRCVACGYDLFGLGDEPRCPECGLSNIPEGLRAQVWGVVDSRAVFISGFFSPFKRRLPGWWWALDRPDDVRRAARVAVGCVLVTFAIIGGAVSLDAAAQRVTAQEWTWLLCRHRDDATCELHSSYVEARASVFGQGERYTSWSRERTVTNPGMVRPPVIRRNVYFEMAWSFESLIPAVFLCLFVFLTWAAPATVGIWTQIRKGLPPFARAPRTILAASLYEAHRLVYAAVLVAALATADTLLKAWFPQVLTAFPGGIIVPPVVLLCVVVFAAAGWVGPLRSDFTRQLIRSRLHAGRIFLMYAVALPVLATFAVASLVWVLRTDI